MNDLAFPPPDDELNVIGNCGNRKKDFEQLQQGRVITRI
jgi:hypothetical protein